ICKVLSTISVLTKSASMKLLEFERYFESLVYLYNVVKYTLGPVQPSMIPEDAILTSEFSNIERILSAMVKAFFKYLSLEVASYRLNNAKPTHESPDCKSILSILEMFIDSNTSKA